MYGIDGNAMTMAHIIDSQVNAFDHSSIAPINEIKTISKLYLESQDT